MDDQKKYQIELFYGYQECEGDTYHAFEAVALDKRNDESKMAEALAQLLDTTPDDERFNWNRMPIALPAELVETIKADALAEHDANERANATTSDRTYIVTEVCPHCESEIEMRWDTDTLGFKAFCPVCGKRLMLCDECRHTSDGEHAAAGLCDYSNQTDSCHRNLEANEEKLAQDMQTLEVRDAELQRLWDALADVPMDPETDKTESSFLHFPSGTDREEIWQWFDGRHSKGVAYLLYGGTEDYVPEANRLYGLKMLCAECDAEHCLFNPEGVCLAPYVTGRAPDLHDDGCFDFCRKKRD